MRWIFDDRTDIDDLLGFEYLESETKKNQRGRWVNPDFPKDNWDYVECYELEDNNHVCDMDCGQKHIKYVHVLYHKEQDLTIHIGKECAVLHIHHHVPEESRANILRALNRQYRKAKIKACELRNYELNRLKLLDFIYSEQNKSVDYVEQLVKSSEVNRIDYENHRIELIKQELIEKESELRKQNYFKKQEQDKEDAFNQLINNWHKLKPEDYTNKFFIKFNILQTGIMSKTNVRYDIRGYDIIVYFDYIQTSKFIIIIERIIGFDDNNKPILKKQIGPNRYETLYEAQQNIGKAYLWAKENLK